MKRILVLFLVFALILSGCGTKSSDSTDSVSPSSDAGADTTASQVQTDDQALPNSDDVSTSSEDASTEIDVDITEKMYVTYINELYVNTPDYLGQVIRLQGMSKAYTDENTGTTYYYVYRTGPGCCGNDGAMCGFEYTFDGTMPNDNDWIEVTGKLRSYEEDGFTYLTLDSSSVTIMDHRGEETVYQ